MDHIKYLFQTDAQYYDNLVEESSLLFAIVFSGIIFLSLALLYKKKKLSLGLIFIILVAVVGSVSGYFREKVSLKDIIRDKQYLATGGRITNFHAMPVSGHDSESFDVNGTHFSIGFTGDYPGKKTMYYTLTKNREGPIERDGQHVKIYYVKTGAFDLCLPFISHCLEFNKKAENKIIKMWVYD